MYGGVAPAAVDAAQDDLYSGYDENQPLDADAQQAASPVGSLSSRPFTGGGANNRLVTGAPGTRGGEEGARPLTSVRAAGYSSNLRAKFDPLKGSSNVASSTHFKKPSKTPERQCKELEGDVHLALEESARYSAKGEHSLALERAKEAVKIERSLAKAREEQSGPEQVNVDLAFSVSLNLGQQYHNNKLYSDALNVYNSMIKNKQFSQSGLIRLSMGNAYFDQEKFPNAIKMYRMSLDQIPTTSKIMKYKILRNIGLSFIRMGQYQDAVQALDSVVENIPDHLASFNLLICMYALGDQERMQAAFLKLLEIQGKTEFKDEENESEMSVHNDGLKQELRRRRNEVHKLILTAAQLIAPRILANKEIEGFEWVVSKLNSFGYSKLANQMDMAKALTFLYRKDFKSAVSCLKGFEKKQQELKAGAATNLSFLYFLEDDTKNAIKYGEMAIDVDRYNAQALVNCGNCHFIRGEYQQAKDMYAEAVSVEADCLEALYNLGLSLKMLESFEEALEVFKKVNNMIPESTDVMYQIGEILDCMGNFKQAMKWFEALNTAVPHDPGVLMQLGALSNKQEDDAKALHFYLESHRVYPANMDVISWLGAFYVKNEVYEKAVPFFELASNIQATEVKWKLMVASCYRRIGAFPLALRKYKEIHKDSPENTECLRYLVHLCNELGGKDEVMSYAKKLKKLEEESRETKAQARESPKNRGGAKAGSPAVRPPSAHGLRRDNAASASKHAEEDADDDWGDTDLHLPGM